MSVIRTSCSTDDNAEADFPERIRILMERYGGATHIAEACGLSESVVRSWRDGRSDPSRQRCLALAQGLGISLTWLVSGEGRILSARRTHDRSCDDQPPTRLSTDILLRATQIMHCTLGNAYHELPLEDRAAFLGKYYTALHMKDPLARTEQLAETHQQLAEYLRRRHSNVI